MKIARRSQRLFFAMRKDEDARSEEHMNQWGSGLFSERSPFPLDDLENNVPVSLPSGRQTCHVPARRSAYFR